jgi:pyruvate,water dikinase
MKIETMASARKQDYAAASVNGPARSSTTAPVAAPHHDRPKTSASGQAASMTRWFDQITHDDIALVGGKNASLGEMIQRLKSSGIRLPDGFAITANAYRSFLNANGLDDRIQRKLSRLRNNDDRSLKTIGQSIRKMIGQGHWPDDLAQEVRDVYRELSQRYHKRNVDVAVRSSATAEDLPEASFAGQLESFLNVRGEDDLLDACRRCFASLFTDRAISYRQQKGFDHLKVAVSVGVQKMVRSDKAGAGVAFTIDTETGFPDVVLINAGWGLGESVVKGLIEPDEYRVFKPLLREERLKPILSKHLGRKENKIVYGMGSRARTGTATKMQKTPRTQQRAFVLSDDEILMLARWCAEIERHYCKPMDIEWAKDGQSEDLYIVQARPETVEARRKTSALTTYRLKEHAQPLLEGQAIGRAIASGPAFVIRTLAGRRRESEKFKQGGILVASMTDPDWVPLMKRAAGIVTDHGGRTSHAAIVSRELGVPAVIGTGNATSRLKAGHEITISCAEGEKGYVYAGALEYEESEESLEDIPPTRTKVMINLASPEGAFRWWLLRTIGGAGVGLARIEFIVNNVIKIHPLALLRFREIKDRATRREIEQITEGYKDKAEFFVEHLAAGCATIAASQYPNPVIVRFSDFKTNEYANLIGGQQFEPHTETNPMLGLRGASRYYSELYRDGFALECAAMKRAREEIGLRNIVAMIPFCRTPEEADRVLEAMAEFGLVRGERGLQVYVMAEVPSNVILADEFAQRFDGFSIGSNDLTQLVLGVDRDSETLAPLFEERHEAVKRAIRDLIDIAHQRSPPVPVGICGQAPSDYPEFAAFLVECGIDSISVNPDSFIKVCRQVAAAEQRSVIHETAA